MVVKERISAPAYERIALSTSDVQWELHRGELREKPGTSAEHNGVMMELAFRLNAQLDREQYRVRANAGRARRTTENYYIPDLMVIPVALERAQRGRPGSLETYDGPLPLVVEIWSPSTADYDVDRKLPEYRARRDREIWRIHPYERTLIVWRWQPSGRYTKALYHGGIVRPASLPGVAIDLDTLFDA